MVQNGFGDINECGSDEREVVEEKLKV